MFSSIVALDLEATDHRAVLVAHALSALGDVPVELVAISPPRNAETEDSVESDRHGLEDGLSTTGRTIVHGEGAARVLTDFVNARDNPLVIMATTAKSPIAGHFLGSISQELLARVDGPMLLLGPRVPADVALTRPTLLAWIDDSSPGEAAVPVIASWMQTFRCSDTQIEVFSTVACPTDDGRAVDPSRGRHFIQLLAEQGIKTCWHVVRGASAESWIEDSADHIVDPILVLPSVRWSDAPTHWHSTSRRLVHLSRRPVLVVPSRHRSPIEKPATTPTDVSATGAFAVHELSVTRCWELLGSTTVGRLATL